MELNQNDILKLAQLARLSLSAVEVERFNKDIGSIVHYVEKVSEVRVKKIALTSKGKNILREDRVLDKFNLDTPFTADQPVQEGLLVVPPVFKK